LEIPQRDHSSDDVSLSYAEVRADNTRLSERIAELEEIGADNNRLSESTASLNRHPTSPDSAGVPSAYGCHLELSASTSDPMRPVDVPARSWRTTNGEVTHPDGQMDMIRHVTTTSVN
jgi:hypothetical protein